MSEEEFRTVAEKLKSVTKYLYFHVMGEPLTHPLLPDFIRIANENGYHPAVTTNGTLLASRGKAMVEAGIYKVNMPPAYPPFANVQRSNFPSGLISSPSTST